MEGVICIPRGTDWVFRSDKTPPVAWGEMLVCVSALCGAVDSALPDSMCLSPEALTAAEREEAKRVW